MPRVARIVVAGLPHHVTQRGNNRQNVFFTDQDRLVYLAMLKEECTRHDVVLLGYCLMDNHVHLVAVPGRANSLAKAIGRTHWKYTQHINLMHQRTGHLWQNRFYSNAMDDDHCLLAMRYIEWNPVRAGICRIAKRYTWSSAAIHCGGVDELGLLHLDKWNELAGNVDWKSVLMAEPSPQQVNAVRRALQTGRPLAGEGLLRKLEGKLGRSVRPSPVGRPKKTSRRKK